MKAITMYEADDRSVWGFADKALVSDTECSTADRINNIMSKPTSMSLRGWTQHHRTGVAQTRAALFRHVQETNPSACKGLTPDQVAHLPPGLSPTETTRFRSF